MPFRTPLRGALLSALAALACGADPVPSGSSSTSVSIPQPVPPTWLLTQARSVDPMRRIAQAERLRAVATGRQARRWDDPELELEAGRIQDAPSGEDRQLRLAVVQRIPFPGTRSRAGAAAEAAAGVADAEQQLADADLVADLAAGVVAVQVAEQRKRLANEDTELVAEVLSAVERRLAVNAVGEADRMRAEVEAAEAAQERSSADLALAAALARLARRIGVALPADVQLVPWPTSAPPGRTALADLTRQHPRLLAAERRIAAARASADAARAGTRPDLTVGGFIERDGGEDSAGVLLGIQVPLWNGNRAGADAARAGVAKALAEAERDQRDVIGAAEAAWDVWSQASTRAAAAKAKLLPTAERSLALAQAAYARGEGDLGDLLDARRTAARVRRQVVELDAEALLSRINLDRALAIVPKDLP